MDEKSARLFVLNILKEGRITIEEADTLINFINGSIKQSETKQSEPEKDNIKKTTSTDSISNIAKEGMSKIERFVSDIGSNIEKVAQNFTAKINQEPYTTENIRIQEKHTFKDAFEIELKDIDNLDLFNQWGAIKILQDERRDNLLVEVKKIIWTKNTEIATDRNEGYKLNWNIDKKKLSFSLPKLIPVVRDSINIILTVPKVSFDMKLETIKGNVILREIENEAKTLDLITQNGNIDLRPAKFKSITINNKHGNTFIKDLESMIKFSSETGNIEYKGKVNESSIMESVEGDIVGDALVKESLSIKTKEGYVWFKQLQNKLTKFVNIKTEKGNIDYRGISANSLMISSDDGYITGESFVKSTSEVKIETKKSDINWKIREEGVGFNFSCESDNGDVFTNIENKDIEKTQRKVKGTINKGLGDIKLHSIDGDIKLSLN